MPAFLQCRRYDLTNHGQLSPQAFCIDYLLAFELVIGKRLELLVIDEQDDDVGLLESVGVVGEFDVVEALESLWQLANVWLDSENLLILELFCKIDGDVESRGLAQVIDVSLEGQAEDRNIGSVGFFHCLLDLVDNPSGLAVVDVASGVDELRVLRVSGNDEPRIDRDAVATDTRARLQDIHAWVVVGEVDELPYVDAELVADERKLVRKSDIDLSLIHI